MKKSGVKVGEVNSLSRKETKKNKQNSNKKIRREGWKREWEIIHSYRTRKKSGR